MAVATPVDNTVKLYGETYSMIEVPAADSAVVKHEQEFSSGGSVDLATFAKDLGNVGKFIRVAYNGVVAAGHDKEYTELAIKIRDSSVRVADLCDSSAITVSEFKQSSQSVLSDLQSTYELLLDGMEDIAAVTYASVGKIATEMKEKANILANGFEAEKKNVNEAANKTKELEDKTRDEVEKDKIKEQELKIKNEEYERRKKEAEKDEQEAKTKTQEFERKEDDALDELAGIGWWGSTFGGKNVQLKKERAAEWKQKRKQQLEIADKRRQERLEAYDEITKCAIELQQVGKDQRDVKEVSAMALNAAGKGLKRLEVVMRQAALYWQQMEGFCKRMEDPKVSKMIKKASQKDEAQRLRFWTSPAFKRAAVEFYAKWVAMGCVCTDYMEHIKVTRKELYGYLVENPTYEEARASIKQLTDDMIASCTEGRKAISAESSADKEELKALENSPPEEEQ